ncbi:MAG: DUF559 domain-containing protein [Candidatus Omnitrophota bacterium]
MTVLYNMHRQKEKRKQLRNNSTIAERILWVRLKGKQLGAKFRRQYGIGYYIVDFCCPRKKLIIEVDGGAHFESEQIEYDIEKIKELEELGFKVLIFSNLEVEK